MAKKPTITTLTSGFNSTTTLNNNFTALRNAFDNTLSLDGSTPNAMNADLDMNSNDILNVGEIDVQALTVDGIAMYPGSAQLATTYATQSYTGNGSTTVYSMGFNPGVKANVNAYIDGVHQNQDAFTISGTSLTFTAAPPLNSAIEIKVPINVTSLVNTDSSAIVYNQGGAGAVTTNVKAKLQESVSVKDFGAVGDGVTDDTAAIQAAIDFSKTSGKVLHVNPGTYILSSTLDLNDGFDNAVSLLGMGGVSNEPTFKFTSSVSVGLLIRNSKASMVRDLVIDMSAVTVDCVGILANAMWESQIQNVFITGPGATNPASGQVSYGLALRPTYNGTVTSWPAASDLQTIYSASGFNMGVYWNNFVRIRVEGFGYGIIMLGAEGGSNPRTNQNQFNSCKFNSNFYGIWMEGIGGGNVFISSTAENAGGDAVTVQNISSGTGPVWIGGEVTATGEQWKGPGMLLNATSGTGFPVANGAGDAGTHIRFTDQNPQLFGAKLTGSGFLSDWDTKLDLPTSGSGTTSSKSFNMATISVDGSGTDAAGYEFSVIMHDGTSPQGSSVMIYHVLLNRGLSQPLTAATSQISARTVWHNLGGGAVAPTVTVSIAGSTATVTANLNWNGVGTDPGEQLVSYAIRTLNTVTSGGWTLTAL